jgi:hypothetical protein
MLSSSGIAIGFLMSTAFWAVVVLFCNEAAYQVLTRGTNLRPLA